MAFQRDQQAAVTGPVGKRLDEGGQQHVVDLRVVDSRHLVQQRQRVVGVEPGRHGAGGAHQIHTVCVVDGQPAGLQPRDILPVGQFSLRHRGLRIGHQPLRPRLERGGLGGKLHRRAIGERRIDGAEVFQQDAPRHAVDHQMMDDQQQPLPACAEIEQGRAQHRAGREVEALLQPVGLPGQGGDARLGVQSRQVEMVERDVIVPGGMRLVPAVRGAAEAQPERVVLRHDPAQRVGEQLRPQRLATLQQHGLIEVVRHGQILREEPVLDRRQRRFALHQSLLGDRRCRGLHHGRQAGDRLLLEDLSGGQLQPGPVGARDHLDGLDRVAAELEEIVVDTDAVEAEHAGQNAGEGLLGRVAGSQIGLPGMGLGRGQRVAVELAV